MGELGPDDGAGNTYSLRPGLQHRFKSSTVKECIHAILKERLANVQYDPEEMPELTKSLSETIKDRLKEEGFDRYKMVVQVVIGEQRGEGVKPCWSTRAMTPAGVWMEENEALLAFRCTGLGYTKSEDSLFCVVAAFGCFYY
ncbi:tctex1 domain-containing protein 2 [Empidonax traillii]|uniref:tctex1 domain-containing protein 2 n=1 Tax=Empidonax traillii TaxID=164674 RepID=UPI000FFD231D|nr:tctex1 domain-containing protein 2 [Empidonax traillii]